MCFNYKRVNLCIILLFVCVGTSYELLSCRDEKDRDVDWYVNYKLPKTETEPKGTNLGDGTAYAYMTARSFTSWRLSAKSVNDSGSLMGNTLTYLYSNKQSLSYLFYNDEVPPSSGSNSTSVGHLKGVLAFDGISGFWLIHSIPKFADDKVFNYPSNALENGQSVLCVTFQTRELNEICNQLLYNHPNIYARGITPEVNAFLDDKAKTLFTASPAFIRKAPFTRRIELKSLLNIGFVSYAKDNQYKYDLYSNLIAPGSNSSLLTETWRRGSGTFLPPSCEADYYVLDITSITMTAQTGRSRTNLKNIAFKSTEDHSKWAISDDNGKNWVCIGDLNRMKSQENRGGGALCFVSAPVWNAYKSLISETDLCPRGRRKK